MSGLKHICLKIEKHVIPKEELKEFVEYMEEENISVSFFYENVQPEDGVLIITDDPDLEMGEKLDGKLKKVIALAGFGSDYQGKSGFVLGSLDVWASYLRLIYARCVNQPFVVAETKRLIIREMTLDDLPDMQRMYDTLKDCTYIEGLYEYEEEYVFSKKYIENMYGFFGHGLWLVYEKESGELVGRAGIENREIDGELQKELGYLIRKDKQKRGYATECVQAILEYARQQLCIDSIFICTHTDNIPSINFAKKMRFKPYAMDVEGLNLYKLELL